MKELFVVLAALELSAAEHTRHADRDTALADQLRARFGILASPSTKSAKPARVVNAEPGAIAPGSAKARILEVLGEASTPMPAKDISAEVKLAYFTTWSHLRDLIEAGRVETVGNGRNRQYGIPRKQAA